MIILARSKGEKRGKNWYSEMYLNRVEKFSPKILFSQIRAMKNSSSHRADID